MSNASYSYVPFENYCERFYERSDASQTVYQCALITILVCGLLANSAVISLVITVRDLRNTSNVFISVLCGANILMLVTFLPLELIDHNSKTLHHTIANLKNFALSFLCCVSVYTLVLLSYERWCAVVRPVITINSNGALWKLTGVVILSGAISLPNAWIFTPINGSYIQYNLENRQESSIAHDRFNAVTIYLFLVLYGLPLAIILVFYSSLSITLLSQRKTIRESVRRNPKARIKRKNMTWVAIGLVVSFAVFGLPFHIYGFLLLIGVNSCPPDPSLLIVTHWRTCIYMLNTCSAPLSIFLLGSRFRRHLCSCLSCLLVIPTHRSVMQCVFSRSTSDATQTVEETYNLDNL